MYVSAGASVCKSLLMYPAVALCLQGPQSCILLGLTPAKALVVCPGKASGLQGPQSHTLLGNGLKLLSKLPHKDGLAVCHAVKRSFQACT